MSDSLLRLIPKEPGFVAPAAVQEAVLALLQPAFPKAGAVAVRCSDEPAFVDAGANFEAVFCPFCERELDQGWWSDAMERAVSADFADLAVTLPCCRRPTTLNDQRYDLPRGFARLVFEIQNPDQDDVPGALLGSATNTEV